MKGFTVMKNKGFASIEVLLIALVCSFMVTVLMDNSFTKRELVERNYKNIRSNLDFFKEEEIFIKNMVENNNLNKDNIKLLEFNIKNKSAVYEENKDAIKVSIKHPITGVFKNTYYDFKFNDQNKIILNKRRYYDLT